MRIIADKGDVVRFQLALSAVARSVSDPEALLEDVAVRSAYPAVVDIFDNEGYGTWAALTPAYAEAKFRIFGELPILERTGNLRASLTLPNSPSSVSSFGSDGSLAIGSSLPYFGAVNNLRPIAQFQEQHFENMLAAATDHIAGVAADVGFEVTES